MSLLKLNLCAVCLLFFTIQITGQQSKKKGLANLLGSGVEVSEDKFDGTTTYTMTGNKVKINGAVGSSVAKGALSLLGGNAQISVATFRLQLEKHVQADGKSELSVILKVSVQDDSPFYPMAGESLIFLVDGQRLGLSTEGEYNASRFNGPNSNSLVFARYPIAQNQLEQILKAEAVEFRILQQHFLEGNTETRDKSDSSMEGEFSKKNFKAWQDFYDDYIL